MSRFDLRSLSVKYLYYKSFIKTCINTHLSERVLQSNEEKKGKNRKMPGLALGVVKDRVIYLVWTPSVESSFWGRKATSS